jgi:hypothetical protein
MVVKLAASPNLGRELSTKKRRVRFVPEIISVIMKTILNINLVLEQFPFTVSGRTLCRVSGCCGAEENEKCRLKIPK